MTIHADRPVTETAVEDQAADVRRKFGISVEDYMLPARHQIQMVNPDGTLRSKEEQGTEPGHEYPTPDDAELLAAYERLVVGRRVNDQNSALVRQGRMAVYPQATARKPARWQLPCASGKVTGCSRPTVTPSPS